MDATAALPVYERRKLSLSLVIVMCLGTIFTGIFCLIGYIVTRQESFASAGLVVFVWVMPTAFLLSLGLVLWNLYITPRTEPTAPSLRVRTAMVVFTMLAMPIAAIVCFGIGVKHATRFEVRIFNNSPNTLSNLKLAGGGGEAYLHELESGETSNLILLFNTDGELQLTFDHPLGSSGPQVIEPYVTGLMGGQRRVEVEEDLSLTISQ